MSEIGFDRVAAALDGVRISRPAGRIAGLSGGRVRVRGLGAHAAIGDLVRLGEGMGGEIVAAPGDEVDVLTDGAQDGLRPGTPVIHDGPARIAPDDSWLGRLVDPSGTPLDGRPILPGRAWRSLSGEPPAAGERRALGARLSTGLRVFNTLLPVVRGQRIGLFAGSGVGKTTLLSLLARGIEADVVVVGLVGERGREVREFCEKVLGPEGMRRMVVVAATSDRPAASRRRCAPAAMAVAEHFRDQGRNVLLLADSVTRHADAHREVAFARGEGAVHGGYPASMPADVMGLCERAGPGAGPAGDITAIFTVLVPGSDMEGPVADVLRGVLDGHVVLDREIAERGRFPAVDLSRSVSRSLPGAADERENTLISEARRLIGAYERSEMMIRAGLYAAGSDRTVDAAIAAWPKLDAFIAEPEAGEVRDSFVGLARCLSRRDK